MLLLLSRPIGCRLNVSVQLERNLTKLRAAQQLNTHTHSNSLSLTLTQSARECERDRLRERERAQSTAPFRVFTLLRLCEWASGRGYARFYLLIEFRAPPTFWLAPWAPSVAPPTRRTVCVGHACDRDGNACQEQSSANCGGNTQNEKFSSYRRHTATVKWSTLTLRLTVSRLGVSLLLRLINGNGNGNGGDERLSYWVMNFSCGSRGFCLVYFSAFPYSTIYFRRSHKIFLQSEQFKTKNKTEADKQNL